MTKKILRTLLLLLLAIFFVVYESYVPTPNIRALKEKGYVQGAK